MGKLLILVSCLGILGCANTPNGIEIALREAKDNKTEIDAAIDYYRKNADDSLKLKAIHFLIENMVGKGFVDYSLMASRSTNPNHTVTDYKSRFDIKGFCEAYRLGKTDSLLKITEDSLLRNTGFSYSFKNPVVKADLEHISKHMLIEHIEEAFDIWNSSLWKDKISYDIFCNYILPYRIDKEPLAGWLPKVRKQVDKLLIDSGLTDTKDPYRVMDVIDNYLKQQYDYHLVRSTVIPRQLSLEEMSLLGGGTCEDLATIEGYWLRAAGIPVVDIKIPIWTHLNAGHSMLAVFWNKDDLVAFNPLDKGNGIQYTSFNEPRRMTSKAFMNPYKLNPKEIQPDKVMAELYGSTLVDITRKIFASTSDLELESIKGSKRYSTYLAVPDRQDWLIVQKGVTNEKGHTIYSHMADNILYLPVSIDKNGGNNPIGNPIIKLNNQVIVFNGAKSGYKRYSFKTKFGWGVKEPGAKVDLFRWEGLKGWEYYSSAVANDSLSLEIDASEGELYYYKVAGQSGLVDRPFMVNKDTILVL